MPFLTLPVLAVTLLFPAAAPAPGPVPALPANVEKVDSAGGISQYRLRSNGMTILLSESHAVPVVTFMVVTTSARGTRRQGTRARRISSST